MDETNTIVEGAEDNDLDNSTYEEAEEITEDTDLGTENDEDADPNKDESSEDDDDGLTYDEDGNVIIPDDDDNASDDGEQTDEETDTETKETPAVNSESKKADEQSNTADSDEVAQLKAEIENLKRQGKAALKAMGVENDDVVKGLVQIAAEAEGVSTEEYLSRQEQEDAAQKQSEMTFAQIAAQDLQALKDLYPACANYKAITDLPNVKRFAELRELGLNAVEAFAATHPTLTNSGAKTPKGSKSHLQTVVPKGASGGDNTIPRGEFNQMKELFPNLSNRELVKLYNKTKRD